MNYKTCKILNDKFVLDEKYNIFLNAKEKLQITDGLEKGYIYAAMYFYDEVAKECGKLEKIVRKHLEAVLMEMPQADTPILLLELSRRVQAAIGDDSLDALVKEVLGETHKHIAISVEPEEAVKWETVKDSILSETIENLHKTIILNPEPINSSGLKNVPLAQAYVEKLTERQKKLLAPALKMVGFLNEIRLDEFAIDNFVVVFKTYATSAPFSEKEEDIKKSLKMLMESNA